MVLTTLVDIIVVACISLSELDYKPQPTRLGTDTKYSVRHSYLFKIKSLRMCGYVSRTPTLHSVGLMSWIINHNPLGWVRIRILVWWIKPTEWRVGVRDTYEQIKELPWNEIALDNVT
jgi:hypothetical protein